MQKALDEQRKERLYLQAEFDNFRKQKMREFDELRQFAAERVVSTLIDDMENLQRLQDHAMKEISQAEAAGAAPDPLGRIRSLHEGVQRVTKHLVEALAATGLREMAAQGADFDPAMHEALAEEARADCRDHEVLQVFQKGYTMHGRVLRPAKVLVGRRTEPKRTQPGAEPGESPEAREGEPPREHPIQENDQKE
jgi:molecular chaperone GrpE